MKLVIPQVSTPGTGKQIQRSISGKTQKEVSQKLKAAFGSP